MRSEKSGKKKEISYICIPCKYKVVLPNMVLLNERRVPSCPNCERGLQIRVKWVEKKAKISLSEKTIN